MPAGHLAFLADRGIPYTTWEGWYRLDAHERARGERAGRERIKVGRDEMLRASMPADTEGVTP